MEKTEIDVPNSNPQITVSPSVIERLSKMMGNSPTTMITSICALFIVVVLSITLPVLLSTNASGNN